MATPVLALGWFAYRRCRTIGFSLIGRNPLAAHISWRADWDAAVAASRARHAKAVPVREDAGGRRLWRTAVGEVWTPRGASLRYVSIIETEVNANVYRLAGMDLTGQTLVDCGANVGMVARIALERGARKVICFEPAPETADCLELNLAPWRHRVDVRRKALWSEPGEMLLRCHEGNPASNSLLNGDGIPVPVSTLDFELRDETMHFLKMDIEGAEVEALRGGKRVISRDLPVVAIGTEHTEDIHENSRRVIEAMREMGYRHECTEAHPYRSPSAGHVLAPHTICFRPSARPAMAAG